MKLQRGINFGGWLSQCDHTKKHYDSFISKADVEQVASWGFDHIRLPFDYNLISDETGKMRESGFMYLDNAVEWCRETGLNLILDLHKAPGYDFNNANTGGKNTLFTSETLKQRFISLWSEVVKRYGKYTHIAFELLNEVVEMEAADSWNGLIKRTVKEIRKYAPVSKIIYGGIQWNSVSTVKLLEPASDKNTIFTFHFYEPLVFTHQKAHWMPSLKMSDSVSYPENVELYRSLSVKTGCTAAEIFDAAKGENSALFIANRINEAIDAAVKAGVPLYCGEFGVIDQAPDSSSLNWFKDIFSVFHKNNIGSALWTYKEMDFGITGNHYKKILPDILKLYSL